MENYNIHLNQNRSKPEFEKKNVSEDEIDLRDYINVLIKRKWAVITIFFIAVIAAVVISLLISPVYEAISLVKIGKIKGVNIETPAETQEIFARRTILKQIATKLNLPEDMNIETVAGIFTIEPAADSLLKIKGKAETPEKSVEITNAVADVLIERHKKIFTEAEEMINLEMENIVKNKEKINKDIENTKEDIIRLEQDIKKYEQEIAKRDNAQSDAQGRITESYINLLATVKNQKESKEAQILNLEQSLVNLDQLLKQKEYEMSYQTKTTEIEIPATPPETRISPKRKQMVMIAGILGLFVGVLYAFGAEYFSKEKA